MASPPLDRRARALEDMLDVGLWLSRSSPSLRAQTLRPARPPSSCVGGSEAATEVGNSGLQPHRLLSEAWVSRGGRHFADSLITETTSWYRRLAICCLIARAG